MFEQFTENSTVHNIPITNFTHLHNHYYTQPLNYSNTPQNNDFIIDDNKELILCENFKFITLKNDTCISDCLRTGHLFEKFIMSYIMQFVPKNKDMLDIGANIGIWSTVYSNHITKKIYAFEPQPEIYNCLIQNINLNNCNNIIPFNIGLSNEDTSYYMNACYDTKQNFGAFRIVDDTEITSKLLKIECKKGDDILQNICTDIGFIKMDVEGFEYNALLGLENLITIHKPLLLIEIHKTDKNHDKTMQFLFSIGYKQVMKLTHCDYLFST